LVSVWSHRITHLYALYYYTNKIVHLIYHIGYWMWIKIYDMIVKLCQTYLWSWFARKLAHDFLYFAWLWIWEEKLLIFLKWEKIHLIKQEKIIHTQLFVFIKDWSRKLWVHNTIIKNHYSMHCNFYDFFLNENLLLSKAIWSNNLSI